MSQVRKGRGIMMLAVGMVIGAFAFGAIVAQAAPKYEDRPFSGAGEGTTTITGMGTDGEVVTHSEGNVIASHVGNSTYTIDSQQDYDRHSEEEHPSQCAFVEDGMDAVSAPGFTITAANGDQILGHLDDDRSVVCAPDTQQQPQPGDIYYTTLYINVDGGTGRFSDADGWLFVEGSSTLQTDGSTLDESLMLGDIDY